MTRTTEIQLDQIAETLARRADAWEAFEMRRRELGVSFEAGQLRTCSVTTRSGVGMRVVAGGRLACGGTSDPTAVGDTIDSVIESAAFGDRAEFDFAPPADSPVDGLHDAEVAQLAPDELVAAGRRILDQLDDIAAEAPVSVHLSASADRTGFVNSPGQRFAYETTEYSLSIDVECFGQDDIFRLWESDAHCSVGGVDADDLVRRVRSRYEQARNVVPAERPKVIVFSPHGLNALLAGLMVGLNGENVADGVSPLADRVGEQLLDERLTVIDDGSLPGRPGTQPFDDEGLPTRRNVLIDAGRVAGFLLDLRTAAELGGQSTGNAARGLTSAPGPAESNTLLAPGDTPLEAMLADVGDGLLVEYLMGVGQGNLLAGDYANSVGLGFRIRDGQVVGRVKNVSIAGNVYEDLRRVRAVEDAAHWFASVCLPHVAVEGIHVSGGE